MLKPFSIRQANLDDLDDVANLFDQYRVFYQQQSAPTAAKFFIHQRISRGESHIYLARSRAREALGFCQLYPTFSSVSMQQQWILNDLYVAAAHRQIGVAKGLLQAAQQLAVTSDSKGVLLCTQNSNTAAQALYTSVGFEPVSNFEWFFQTAQTQKKK